jgi:anti-sigma regulatory factor (Ser/Thr protein kinase)
VDAVVEHAREESFAHEALFYADEDEFLDGTLRFLRAGIADGEPALVVLSGSKIERLRSALGREAAHVAFADMAEVGANPARIIPAWRDFVSAEGGAPVRGIGEPIWAGRGADELVECQRHESLLNLAFAGERFRLLCPYDTAALPDAVLEEALASHAAVVDSAGRHPSGACRSLADVAAPFDVPLPDPPPDALEVAIRVGTLAAVRRVVGELADEAELPLARHADLVLAVGEIAANTVRHGGGRGVLRAWAQHDRVVCDVRDTGRIADPLAGRARPPLGSHGGRGLWIANQLCDLVQIRALPTGTAVRLHVRRDT